MKKILLAGGTGYIGSALQKFLEQSQIDGRYKITSVDLEWFGNYTNKSNLKIDYSLFSEAFFRHFDTIIVLAGFSSVGLCDDNIATFHNNVTKFVDFTSKLSPNQKLIVASSSSVYGSLNEKNCTEDNERVKPVNFYDLSKLFVDQYLKLSKFNYYSLRFGTVAGCSPNLRIDTVLNAFVNKYKIHKQLEVFDGKINRPILGMGDLCRAIKAIIDKEEDKRGIYNLASFNTTIENLAYDVSRTIDPVNPGLDCPIIHNAGKIGSSYDFSISTNKFCNAFGFEFIDTANSITVDLLKNWDNMAKGVRISPIRYGS